MHGLTLSLCISVPLNECFQAIDRKLRGTAGSRSACFNIGVAHDLIVRLNTRYSFIVVVETMERKLSTILAADVVGFSKMMATDEEGTLEILKNRRFVIDNSIKEQGGKIFGSAGDSVIAEFDSPVKATECGVQFQSKMQALNDNIAEDQQMIFRVGIHIGDVMVAEDNLFGDAVNIAARLEAEAKPGGLCLSKTVVDIVGGKLKVSFEDAGELALKSIDRPVQALFVVPSKGATRWVHDNTEGPKVKIQKAEPGSLAVMLFKNLSKDEEQD